MGAPLGSLTLWLLPGLTASQWDNWQEVGDEREKSHGIYSLTDPSLPPILLLAILPFRYSYGYPQVALI